MKQMHVDMSIKLDEFMVVLDSYVKRQIANYNSPHIEDQINLNEAEYNLRKKLGKLLDYDMGD
jgi:hypothetical protein